MGMRATESFLEGKGNRWRFQSQAIILVVLNFSNWIIFIKSDYRAEGYNLFSL